MTTARQVGKLSGQKMTKNWFKLAPKLPKKLSQK